MLHGSVFPISKACDSSHDSRTDKPFVSHFSVSRNCRTCQNLSIVWSAISLLQTLFVLTLHYLQHLQPVPKWRWLPLRYLGLCRRCQPGAPSPAALRLSPLSSLAASPLQSFSRQISSAFPFAKTGTCFFMAWLILTFNADSHQGERHLQFFQSGTIHFRLFSRNSFISSPAWTEGFGSQEGVVRGLLVPLGVGTHLQSALVQFRTPGVMEFGPGAWCRPALTHCVPPGKTFNTRLWYLSLHYTLHQKGSRWSQWSYLWSACT